MSCRYSVNERLINLQHDIINTNSSGEGCISNEDKPNSNSNSKSTKAFWLVMCAQLTGRTAQYETNIPHTHTPLYGATKARAQTEASQGPGNSNRRPLEAGGWTKEEANIELVDLPGYAPHLSLLWLAAPLLVVVCVCVCVYVTLCARVCPLLSAWQHTQTATATTTYNAESK